MNFIAGILTFLFAIFFCLILGCFLGLIFEKLWKFINLAIRYFEINIDKDEK